LALCFDRAKYNVLAVDIFPDYVKALNDRTFNSKEPRVNEFLAEADTFRATTDIKEGIEHSDILYVLVDTPSTGGNRHYDTSKLGNVLAAINAHKVENKHVIIGCTIMPGYIRNIASHLLRDCKNTSISYNPEFIQQGDIIRGFLNPDMVLIGEGCKEIGDHMVELYKDVCENTPVMGRMAAESAEICKIAINCFITTKISYCNMVGDIADRTPGAEKNEILAAVGADSRIGTKCLRPGYGFGGPCFPRDNRALGGYAKSIGINPLIPIATDEYNNLHTEIMIQNKLAEDKPEYIFSDVAYKPQCPVPIIEESQKLAVAQGVAKAGKKVVIEDRDFIIACVRAEFGHMFEYRVVA
jgi:nucleotide sugar dehydrogenase